jgi:pyrroloquinoline quinone biosynthesis protein B
VSRRTQSSIAARGLDDRWVLINASPDLREQIIATASLAPAPVAGHAAPHAMRGTPIGAVVLTNADVDHIAGLLSLRERSALTVFATPNVLEALASNPIFNVLDREVVRREPVHLETPFEPVAGIWLTLFSVPGKVPLWGETGEVATDVDDGRTVGVAIADNAAGPPRTFYMPGVARLTPDLSTRVRGARTLLFDGTVYDDDEMIRLGLGVKTGRRMGHMPINGEGGSCDAFHSLAIGRKIYIHINNTNPILIAGSPERERVERAGWEVGADGMEIAL